MSQIELKTNGPDSKIKTGDIITDEGQKKTEIKISLKLKLKYMISGFIMGVVTSMIAEWIYSTFLK